MDSAELLLTEKNAYTYLSTLLQNNRIFDSFYTHVSLIQPKGKYSLSARATLEDFWSYYQQVVQADYTIGLAEVPQEYIPVLVDIDLKFAESIQPQYSSEFVRIIIQCYIEVLREHLEIPKNTNTDQLFACAWLNKPAYCVEKDPPYWKNGFHLHFFNLFVSKYDLEARIIPRVIQKLETLPEGEWMPDILNRSDFLDRKAIGNTWLLYGSSKAENMKPYKLFKVYDGSLNNVTFTQCLAGVHIYDANEERIHLNEANYEFYLPRIFSILPAGRKVYDIKKVDCIRQAIASVINHMDPQRKQPTLTHRTKEQIREDTMVARELVALLSPNRAIGHNDWLTIGWALYNITNESDEGLNIWIKFSLQTPDHDEARCIYEWSRMQNRQIMTLGTLKWFARTDNEQAYTNYMAKLNAKKQIKLTEKGLAELFAKHCQGEFVYCKKSWYEFKGNFWEEADEAISLKVKIFDTLVPLLKKIRTELKAREENGEEEEDPTAKKPDKIGVVLAKLETVNFLASIVEACKLSFHDQTFENKLDRNCYLIGFENGVYDLQQNVFRVGCPSDYIMNHLPIAYKEFNETDDEVVEVKQFFEKVFPNPNLRRYFMDIMSEIFVGYNHRKHVYFWIGGGDNAKSMTQKLFEKMLGKMSIKAPTTLLTSKKPAVGSATEELARSGGGVRTMWLEEPDPDEEICQGFLKQLSGNDAFYTRGLYKSGKEVEPMFKMFIVCNSLPKFKYGGDNATWNRARVIKFESTFCADPPASPEEQLLLKRFPRDPTLDRRIPQLSQALAWLLLEHRKLPRIEDPIEVITATAEYRQDNDTYAQFVEMCFVPREGHYANVIVAQENYKEFVREYMNRPNAKLPSLKEFMKTMVKFVGPIDEQRYAWPNFQVRSFRMIGEEENVTSARNLL